MGIGAGLIYLPAIAVQAHHWKARRALAMGIVITGTSDICGSWLNIYDYLGSSVGGVVYPIMLNNLFHSSAGFAWGVRASAFLTLGILAAAVCLMSANPQEATAGQPKAEVHDIIRDTPFMLVGVAG